MTHGGPTSMATSGLDTTIQFWVSRGFAVLDVNYSGSTGFGRAYRDRLRGNWGLLDVSDTVAAVEAVTRRGLADPSRVAITGGSAGGYTTLRSLTTTGRYAAGISRYGIGDLTTLVTDTHKAESRYPEGLIAPWPTGRAVYEDRSPSTTSTGCRRRC
ncbi:prolyl oligopeptidase family serine peptidase [Tessaracoccus sp. HDW20]|nr:prolyl oligopeptidase family serine peptidase [Tessaracoccus coleopterorum]